MVVVLKLDISQFDLAFAFAVDNVRAVDEYLGHGLVVEQLLDRAEAEDLVEHHAVELLDLRLIQRCAGLAIKVGKTLGEHALTLGGSIQLGGRAKRSEHAVGDLER